MNQYLKCALESADISLNEISVRVLSDIAASKDIVIINFNGKYYFKEGSECIEFDCALKKSYGAKVIPEKIIQLFHVVNHLQQIEKIKITKFPLLSEVGNNFNVIGGISLNEYYKNLTIRYLVEKVNMLEKRLKDKVPENSS